MRHVLTLVADRNATVLSATIIAQVRDAVDQELSARID